MSYLADYFSKYDHLSEALQESIDPDEYVIGTYYVALPPRIDPWYIGRIAAEEQSTGTWVPVPENTPELRARCTGKVLGVYEIPNYEFALPDGIKERSYIFQIGFPMAKADGSFGFLMPNIPALLTSLFGNISMGGKIKILDITFPKPWLEHFKGPKFGIEGIRKLLKVPDRSLLNNMIKPNTGWSPEVGAKLFYQAAVGGCDVVKDDELIADHPYNRIADRIPLMMEKVDQVREETGEETLYTVNITDRADKVRDLALQAIDAGTNALMANFLVVGLDTFRSLAEDPEIKVPILAHMDFAGAIYESPISGMSSFLVLGKMVRLIGADIVVFPAPYGKAPIIKDKYMAIARALRYRFGGLKPTLPMPSGGITPGMVLEVMKDLGTDVLIGSGGGIHAHPDGSIAGARAFRQAIDIGMQQMEEASDDFEDFVEDHEDDYPELARAMEEWGIKETKFA